MAKKYQVVIVGGGPVGVGLAVDLGLRGISCLLIERHLTPQRIPKGQSLGQRTLEHFHFWGIEKELRAARVMPKDYPIGGVAAWGNLMSDYWYAPPGREVVRRYFYQDNERLPQYQTEGVLRTKMATLPSVESRFGWTAEKLEQDANGVRVVLAERDGPERVGSGRETVEAEYVVGCDGAHSSVREQVGITRGGVNHDQVMVLAVFRSKELHEGLKRFPERSTYRAMDKAANGYWQFFGRVDVGEGFFFHAPVPADTTKDNYDFHGLLQKVAGFKFKAEFDYVGFWDMRIAVATSYQVGRVFIAGDAAHSHPPYGGYGLNSGLEDARNLGWKLAAVLQGWGGKELLRSYSDERRLIFEEIGRDFIGNRIEFERDFMEKYSPEKDRAEFERQWAKMSEKGEERVSGYEPNYEGSSVVCGPPNGISTAHGKHMVKARAGHHLTPRTLSSGRDIYQELDAGFALIALDAEDAAVRAFEAAAAANKVPLKVIRDSYADGREQYESKLILVRPDQYVVWAGDAHSNNDWAGDAAKIMTKVVGLSNLRHHAKNVLPRGLNLRNSLIMAAALVAAAVLATPTVAQKSKDTLRFPILDGESTLDQYLSPGAFHYTWAPAVYDSLVGFDPKKGEFQSFLAKSWTQPNPSTYEYTLREDVKWHDGQALDADDVVYTLNYLTDPKVNLRYKAQWAWIQSVEKLGPHKVRITAKRPVPDGLMWMSNSTVILPEHAHGPLENKQDFGARPIGTGPYKVTRLDRNAGIFVEKNPNFVVTPAKPAAKIGRVVGEPIPDAGTLVAALLVGKADLAFDVPVDQAAELRNSGRFESSLAPAAVAYSFVGFPSAAWPNVKALSDPRVRLAIAKAIDRQALIDVQYGELGRSIKPSDGLCSKEQLGCGFTKLKPDYDPAGAKKLLAEAGYADGFDVTISTHPTSVVPATAVSGMLRAVGIRASVRPHQIVQRVQLINQGKVEIGFYGWSGGALFEASGQIVRHVGSKEYDDPALANMANATMGMMDDAERRKAVAKVFDYIHDNAYAFPMVPLRSIYTHTKEVKLDVSDEIRESQLASVHEFSWK